MQAGVLNEQIKVYKEICGTTEYGEQTTEYVFVYETRARQVYNALGRSVEAHEVVYPMEITLEVRWYIPLEDRDRIEFRGDMYRIIKITPEREYQKKVAVCEKIND